MFLTVDAGVVMNSRKYAQRYYGDYKQRCSNTHRLHGQRCVICYGKSEEIHHALYGNDIPGKTIFSVCRHCHENICHSPENWIKSSNPMKCRNTPQFTTFLRTQYIYLKRVHNKTKGQLSWKK